MFLCLWEPTYPSMSVHQRGPVGGSMLHVFGVSALSAAAMCAPWKTSVDVCASGCRNVRVCKACACVHMHPHLRTVSVTSSLLQGCCPRAWSSTLPRTTTPCAKATTPPSGTSHPGDSDSAPLPSRASLSASMKEIQGGNPDLQRQPATWGGLGLTPPHQERGGQE